VGKGKKYFQKTLCFSSFFMGVPADSVKSSAVAMLQVPLSLQPPVASWTLAFKFCPLRYQNLQVAGSLQSPPFTALTHFICERGDFVL
jgi:hypothetical protein